MKKIIILLAIFSQLAAAEFENINAAKFDELKASCTLQSISKNCLFVGLNLLSPDFATAVFKSPVKFTLKSDEVQGLKLLSRACKYDKNAKIKAIKSKAKEEKEINANPLACYTMFAIYENFSEQKEYYLHYAKAMQPYFADYDELDLLALAKQFSKEQKDMKKALGYYKFMCYEKDLQLQCAKYQGLKNKLKKLCEKGEDYACVK